MEKFTFGCHKDPEDKRDLMYKDFMVQKTIPDEFDLSKSMTAVGNQMQLGSCVSWAAKAVKERQELIERGTIINLSAIYLYKKCKFEDQLSSEGTYPRVAVSILSKYGICREELCPYDISKFPSLVLSPEMDQDASKYKIKAFTRLTSISEMENSLITNGPFIAGLLVDEKWFQNKGEIITTLENPNLASGHAIAFVGYSKTNSQKYFIFKNSWSENWGEKGYGKVSYEYVEKYLQDSWAIVDMIETAVEAAQAIYDKKGPKNG